MVSHAMGLTPLPELGEQDCEYQLTVARKARQSFEINGSGRSFVHTGSKQNPRLISRPRKSVRGVHTIGSSTIDSKKNQNVLSGP